MCVNLTFKNLLTINCVTNAVMSVGKNDHIIKIKAIDTISSILE